MHAQCADILDQVEEYKKEETGKKNVKVNEEQDKELFDRVKLDLMGYTFVDDQYLLHFTPWWYELEDLYVHDKDLKPALVEYMNQNDIPLPNTRSNPRKPAKPSKIVLPPGTPATAAATSANPHGRPASLSSKKKHGSSPTAATSPSKRPKKATPITTSATPRDRTALVSDIISQDGKIYDTAGLRLLAQETMAENGTQNQGIRTVIAIPPAPVAALDTARAANDEVTRQLHLMTSQVKAASGEIERLNALNKGYEGELAEAHHTVTELRRKLARLDDGRVKELEQHLDEARANASSLQQELSKATDDTARVHELEEEIKDLHKQLEALEKAQARVSELDGELADAKGTIECLKLQVTDMYGGVPMLKITNEVFGMIRRAKADREAEEKRVSGSKRRQQ